MSFVAACMWAIALISICVWITVVFDYREALYRYGTIYRRRAIGFLLRIFWPIGLLYVIGLFFHSTYCIIKIAINGKDE